MFTFFTPLALFGAFLLVVPTAVHIFKPRKVRQTPFSSLRWLRDSRQRLARRIEWHQLLLYALRALFVLFLVVALAKPVLSLRGKKTFSERFIVLDVSRSMNYQLTDRPTPFEQGKQIALDLLPRGMAGDRTAVLLTGNTTSTLGPLSSDPAIYNAPLKAAKPTMSNTDLTSALQAIRPMLASPRSNTSVELYFITDDHRNSWSEAPIAAFQKGLGLPVATHVIDVGIASPQNAWIADARLADFGGPARRVIRIQAGCVGDEGQQRTLRVTRLPGVPEFSQKVDLLPGQLVKVECELPENYDIRGKVAQIQLEPKDALPDDDIYWLSLDARGMVRILVIEAESTQADSLQSGFHLRTALEALSYSESGSLQVVRKTPSNVASTDFNTADVVVLVNIPQLADGTLASLENRVKAGAGLAVFLGPAIQLPFYNNRFYNASRPQEGLMPAPLKNMINAYQNSGQLGRLTRIQWSHPMLAPLFDPTYGDLAQTRFRTYYNFDPSSSGSGSQVLAWIDDVVPAVVERTFGTGKVVVFNLTANDEWSDLPRRKSFVPLLDRLISRLGGGSVRRIFQVGEPISIPIPPLRSNDGVTVTAPSKKTLTPAIRTTGAQTVLRLEALDEIGVYTIQYPSPDINGPQSFVVQTPRGDSVLTKIDADTLKSWWQPASLEIVRPDPNARSVALTQGRVLLWPWFVAAACLMMLGEMFFVHWLCPKVNPKVAVSTVGTHGILAPTAPSTPPPAS
jgi:hypothetical protein